MPKLLKDELASEYFSRSIVTASKTQIEDTLIGGFLERLGLSSFQPTRTERPDFLIQFPEASAGQIGCEVTRYFADGTRSGSQKQKHVAMWISFAEKLRVRLEHKKASHIYGALHLKPSTISNFEEFLKEDDLVNEIIRVVAKHTGQATVECDQLADCPTLNIYGDRLYLMDTTPETGILWWCAHLRSGPVPEPLAFIQETITRKDFLATKYNWPACREKWLLIYAGGSLPEDTVVLREPLSPRVSSTLFDRVFLWDKFQEQIHQVFPEFLTILEYPKFYKCRLPEFLRDHTSF